MPIISEATFGTYTGYNDEFDSIIEAVGTHTEFQGFGDLMMAQAINEAKIFEYMIASDYAELDAIQEDAGYNTGRFGLNRKYSEDPKVKKSVKDRYDAWEPKNKVTGGIKKGIDAIIKFVTTWFGKFKTAIETAIGKITDFIGPKLKAVGEKINFVKRAEEQGKLDTCPVPSWSIYTDYGINFSDNAAKLYDKLGKEARTHISDSDKKVYDRKRFEGLASSSSDDKSTRMKQMLIANNLYNNKMGSDYNKKAMVSAAFENIKGQGSRGEKGKLFWSDVKGRDKTVKGITDLYSELKDMKRIFKIRKSVSIAKKTIREFVASIKKREGTWSNDNEAVKNARTFANTMTRIVSMVGSADIAIVSKRFRQSFATLMALTNYAAGGRQIDNATKPLRDDIARNRQAAKAKRESLKDSYLFTESVWYEAAGDFTEAVTDYYTEETYYNESEYDMDDSDLDFED